MKFVKYFLLIAITIIIGFAFGCFLVLNEIEKENQNIDNYCQAKEGRFWELQSVDTMKYSRDLALEKLADESFAAVIDAQVAAIAGTGATHVSVGTPYDKEFIPFLGRWVEAAREHGLNVWFRGNLSGWEGWFGYEAPSRIEHIAGIRNFILGNPGLFADGDIFDPCPECENGRPGDPRDNPNLAEYRRFLIDEYRAAADSFAEIGRRVKTGYFSMNGDVARLVMDPATATALNGLVVADHYVYSGEQLALDIGGFALNSQSRVVLGEFGYPIPDIHGPAGAKEQAEWLDDALSRLVRENSLAGLNYWTSTGGSTALWDDDGRARPAAAVLAKYYLPDVVCGRIVDEAGWPVENAGIAVFGRKYQSGQSGFFRILIPRGEQANIEFSAAGYKDAAILYAGEPASRIFVLESTGQDILTDLRRLVRILYLKLQRLPK